MKKVLFGAFVALAGLTQSAAAEFTVTVRGADYPLAALMDSCIDASGGPEAQLRCFVALTGLVKEQSGAAAPTDLTVTEALGALRTAAEYRTQTSGLTISGTGCRVDLVYYNNYFHMSRRNVTTIDLLRAQFDAADLQLDQTRRGPSSADGFSTGLMRPGSAAITQGGAALASDEQKFEGKPASASIEGYARTLLGTLPSSQNQSFDFVLVHPERSHNSDAIWSAFQSFVTACQR